MLLLVRHLLLLAMHLFLVASCSTECAFFISQCPLLLTKSVLIRPRVFNSEGRSPSCRRPSRFWVRWTWGRRKMNKFLPFRRKLCRSPRPYSYGWCAWGSSCEPYESYGSRECLSPITVARRKDDFAVWEGAPSSFLAPSSKALVPSSFLLLLVRHLFLVASCYY